MEAEMTRKAIVLLAVLAGACTAATDNGANETNAAAARTVNLASETDCPAEELSCGRQRPVVSDGVTRFRNDNMYLSVVFPAGSQVCMTRSGDSPRGFFAVYGAPPGCPERPERPPRFIVLNTMFNANFHERAEDIAGLVCDPVSPETRRRRAAAPLALPRVRTQGCE
jgi:hypothetical protein